MTVDEACKLLNAATTLFGAADLEDFMSMDEMDMGDLMIALGTMIKRKAPPTEIIFEMDPDPKSKEPKPVVKDEENTNVVSIKKVG